MSPQEAVEYGLIDQVIEGPVQTETVKSSDSESSD